MKPSPFQTRMINAALSLDYAKGEDYTSAVLAKVMSTGVVMFELYPRGIGKSWGMYDMMHWPYTPQRSSRNRHHKANAQPNCGPRGNNPW